MSAHNDITGQPLNVGDRVAYATKAKGDRVVQKLGVILELIYVKANTHGDPEPPLVKVRVDQVSNNAPITQHDLTRLDKMVKLWS